MHEMGYLEDIAKKLESNGFKCFLPHRDQSGVANSELEKTVMSAETKDKIFNNDLDVEPILRLRTCACQRLFLFLIEATFPLLCVTEV